jgi:hypothetical protein
MKEAISIKNANNLGLRLVKGKIEKRDAIFAFINIDLKEYKETLEMHINLNLFQETIGGVI